MGSGGHIWVERAGYGYINPNMGREGQIWAGQVEIQVVGAKASHTGISNAFSSRSRAFSCIYGSNVLHHHDLLICCIPLKVYLKMHKTCLIIIQDSSIK